MTLLNWPKPKFTTFDEGALKDGSLEDAALDVLKGDTPPVAVVKSITKGVTMTTDTSPSVGTSTVEVANKASSTSKTLWANLIIGTLDMIGHFGGFIPPQYQPYIVLATTLLNFGLRFISNAPITLTGTGTTTVQNNVKV